MRSWPRYKPRTPANPTRSLPEVSGPPITGFPALVWEQLSFVNSEVSIKLARFDGVVTVSNKDLLLRPTGLRVAVPQTMSSRSFCEAN